jgi:hypothetical protein
MLVFCLRRTDGLTSTTNHVLSNRLKSSLSRFQLRVGSAYYPPKEVVGTSQMFGELLKAFHIFSTTSPTTMDSVSYNRDVVGQTNAADDPTLKGSFVTALDFEGSIHNKSDVMLAGLNTLNNVQTFLDLTFSGAHAACQLDVYVCYDLLLSVQNGQVSAQY